MQQESELYECIPLVISQMMMHPSSAADRNLWYNTIELAAIKAEVLLSEVPEVQTHLESSIKTRNRMISRCPAMKR